MEKEREPRLLKTEDLANASERDRSELSKGGRAAAAAVTGATANVGNGTPSSQAAPARAELIEQNVAQDFQTRWNTIQVSFVDEPRQAVEQADNLVAETMKRLAESFAKERTGLETQWDQGDQVSTEDLRQALQRYRSFFNRLLAA